MSHYAIVIEDPDKHQQAAIARNPKKDVERQIRAAIARAKRERSLSPEEEQDAWREGLRLYADRIEAKRDIGDLHTTAESECPDGMPNCRNCGDPAFEPSCRAAGHCPHCGRRHGIAPDSYLAASGVVLVAVDAPEPDAVWDRTTRRFRRP